MEKPLFKRKHRNALQQDSNTICEFKMQNCVPSNNSAYYNYNVSLCEADILYVALCDKKGKKIIKLLKTTSIQ